MDRPRERASDLLLPDDAPHRAHQAGAMLGSKVIAAGSAPHGGAQTSGRRGEIERCSHGKRHIGPAYRRRLAPILWAGANIV
jgi:hypothetical protein